jgi:hypothetical protein
VNINFLDVFAGEQEAKESGLMIEDLAFEAKGEIRQSREDAGRK